MAWDSKREHVPGEVSPPNERDETRINTYGIVGSGGIKAGGAADITYVPAGEGIPRFDDNSVYGSVRNERLEIVNAAVLPDDESLRPENLNRVFVSQTPERKERLSTIDTIRRRRLEEIRAIVEAKGGLDHLFTGTDESVVLPGDPQQQPASGYLTAEDGEMIPLQGFTEEARQELVRAAHEIADVYDRKYEQELRHPGALRASKHATSVLDTYALILPQRLVNEELGDFIEDINRRAAEGQSNAKIYLRVAAAMFWTSLNALGYITANLLGKKKGA